MRLPGLHDLDAFLLVRVFMPISGLLGRRFGKTNTETTRLMAGIVIVVWLLAALTQLPMINPKDGGWWYVASGLFCSAVWGMNLLQSAESADTWPNLNIYVHFISRMIMVLLFIFLTPLTISILWHLSLLEIENRVFDQIGNLAVVCGLYFSALPPAPPKKQRAPKLSRSLVPEMT